MPPSERTSHLNLKLTPGERQLVEDVANERGLTLSDAARLMMFNVPPSHRHRRSKPGVNRRTAKRGRKVNQAERPRVKIKAKP